MRAPLERVWENVRDWEHLPWLHRTSFASIALERASRDGWRARVGLQPAGPAREILLELRIDAPRLRYVSHTLEGPGAHSEIWTTLDPREGETDIEVEFLLPDVRPGQADALGKAFVSLYTRLWDEDESMMLRRGARLAQRVPGSGAERVGLGTLHEVRARAPFQVDLAGVTYRVLDVAGELAAHAVVCPHLLGPLEEAELADGRLACPWHGYRYDLRSGRCAEHPEYALRIGRLEVDPASGQVELCAAPR